MQERDSKREKERERERKREREREREREKHRERSQTDGEYMEERRAHTDRVWGAKHREYQRNTNAQIT